MIILCWLVPFTFQDFSSTNSLCIFSDRLVNCIAKWYTNDRYRIFFIIIWIAKWISNACAFYSIKKNLPVDCSYSLFFDFCWLRWLFSFKLRVTSFATVVFFMLFALRFQLQHSWVSNSKPRHVYLSHPLNFFTLNLFNFSRLNRTFTHLAEFDLDVSSSLRLSIFLD